MRFRDFLPISFVILIFVLFTTTPVSYAQEEVLPDTLEVEEEIILEEEVIEEDIPEEEIFEEEVIPEEEIIEEEVAPEEEIFEEEVLPEEEIIEEEVAPEEEVVEEASEEKVTLGHDLVVGASFGGMIPIGQNIKDRFNMGIPFTIHAKVSGLVEISGMSLGAGLELGYYMASAETGDDLSGIPILAFGDLDLSNLLPLPPEMGLGVELGLGLHLQSAGDSFTYLGLTPGVVFRYEVMEGIEVLAKLRASEILSSDEDFGGTQEWIDLRIGVNYTLSNLLPF